MTVVPSIAPLSSAGDLVAAKKFVEAEAEILRVVAQAPADPKALTLLGLVRYKLGRLEDARATYRDIVAAAPQDADARRNLGLLALKLGDLDEAQPQLEMAVRIEPGDTRAWSYLGYAFAKRGEVVAAAAAFRRAGQDALAVELEHAAKIQRPSAARGGGTLTGAPGPDFARAALSRPVALAPPLPPLTAEPTAVGRRRRATQPPGPVPLVPLDGESEVGPNGTPSRVEADAVPLLAFVRARLGQAVAPAAPRGALRLTVADEVYARSDAVLAGTGQLRWERGVRRAQGRLTTDPLGASAALPFFRLTGAGSVWIAGAPDRWIPLRLTDDVLYVREDQVLAFEGALAWEAGSPADCGVSMLQFRGRGTLAVQVPRHPIAVEVTSEAPVLVSAARLYGWIGRLVPRAPAGAGLAPFQLVCEGEGIVLLEAVA